MQKLTQAMVDAESADLCEHAWVLGEKLMNEERVVEAMQLIENILTIFIRWTDELLTADMVSSRCFKKNDATITVRNGPSIKRKRNFQGLAAKHPWQKKRNEYNDRPLVRSTKEQGGCRYMTDMHSKRKRDF